MAKSPLAAVDAASEKQVKAALREWRKAVVAGIVEGMTASAFAVETIAKRNIDDLDAVDRGFTRASIDSRVVTKSKGSQVVAVEAEVFVGTAWGVWVERGRKGSRGSTKKILSGAAEAAWPPVDAIRDWVRRNYTELAPRGRNAKGRAIRGAAEDQDKAINSLAFLIGRAIFYYGIEARPFLGPAAEAVAPKVPGVLNRAIQKKVAATSNLAQSAAAVTRARAQLRASR